MREFVFVSICERRCDVMVGWCARVHVRSVTVVVYLYVFLQLRDYAHMDIHAVRMHSLYWSITSSMNWTSPPITRELHDASES